MAKSMTGFGRGEYTDDLRTVTVEIKSVNHRYSDINVKLSRRYQFAEDSIKALVKNVAPRGKIDVFVNVDGQEQEGAEVKPDFSLAKQYCDALMQLKEELPGIFGDVSLSMLASFPEVIKTSAARTDEEAVLKALCAATEAAAANLDSMRLAEGVKLTEDILERNEFIEKTVGEIEVYAPEIAANYARKMKERLQELLGEDASISEDRIMLEAAVFADKSAINEELVRLRSHCAQLKDICADASQPIGKKLDFLVQEMNREANTIGSKAGDVNVTGHVLILKAEIEKIREQVQNIE